MYFRKRSFWIDVFFNSRTKGNIVSISKKTHRNVRNICEAVGEAAYRRYFIFCSRDHEVTLCCHVQDTEKSVPECICIGGVGHILV